MFDRSGKGLVRIGGPIEKIGTFHCEPCHRLQCLTLPLQQSPPLVPQQSANL